LPASPSCPLRQDPKRHMFYPVVKVPLSLSVWGASGWR